MGVSSSNGKRKKERHFVPIVCVYCEAIKVDVSDKEKSMVENISLRIFLCILLFDMVKIRSNLIIKFLRPRFFQPKSYVIG